MGKESMKRLERVFLIIEMVFIFLFMGLTITEIILAFNIYSDHLMSEQYYYSYMVHKRLIPTTFNAYIKAINPLDFCPYYPPPEENQKTRIYYTPRKIFELGKVHKAELNMTTNDTQIYDPLYSMGLEVVNNTRAGYDFFHFEIQKQGNSTLDLLTNYQFNVWKGVKICTVQLKAVDPEAFVLIPKENSCKEFLQNEKTQSCGVYLDTYRFCVQLQHIQINDTLPAVQVESSTWADQGWACPFNYFDMDFTPNPSYERFDMSSLAVSGKEYMQFQNTPTDPKYQHIVDKYLFFDYDNLLIGDYQKIENPREKFIFYENNINEYTIGQKYGFIDSFSGIFETYDFDTFYNDTYYDIPVYNKATGRTTYEPYYLSDVNGMKYYLPIDKNSTKKLNVSLTYSLHPTLSKECFTEYIAQEKVWAYWKQIKLLSTENLDESLPLLIAWLFVKLFIAIYWHFKIRYSLIKQKLSRGYLNPPDEKSEFMTKFTAKLSTVIMFALTLHGTLYQQTNFKQILHISESIIKYKCYPDDLTINSINEYKTQIQQMDLKNTNIMLCIFISAVLESTIFVYYSYELFQHWKKKREEQEALKKD